MSKFNVGDKVVFCGTESIITAIQTREEALKGYLGLNPDDDDMKPWYLLEGEMGLGFNKVSVHEDYLECENNKHKKEKD